MHLVGFIIRIYHDARPSACQILPVFGTSTSEVPHPTYFIACNVNKKRGSLGILFTEYTAMGWWIYNNMGYIVMSCTGIHSHGHCKLPPTTNNSCRAQNNNILALFNNSLELICSHLINTGSLFSC